MKKALVTLALVSLLTSPLAAAEENGGSDALGKTRGAFIALSVADVATMSAWYQEKLGLKVLKDGEAPNKIAKFALLMGDGIIVELIQHTKAQSRAAAAPSIADSYQLHGIFKAGLIVADLDSLYTGLKQKGATIAYDIMPAKDVPMRSFTVRDPEGNMVQFFGK
jgi:catechol 2,3-dioxygenase-like lactoylglutathione lyase family enzyme